MDDPVSFPRLGPFAAPSATFSFDTFINGLASMGLPVTIVRRLRDAGWEVKIVTGQTESGTSDNWFSSGGTIKLAQVQCFPIANPGVENTVAFLDTIFHEFTHAFLDQFGDRMQPLLATARLHYLGSNMADGSTKNIDLVMQESAADYVGSSMGAAVRLLLTCRGLSVGVVGAGATVDDDQKKSIAASIFADYANFLRQSVFGFIDKFNITKTIDPRLQAQLDIAILERLRERAVPMAQAIFSG